MYICRNTLGMKRGLALLFLVAGLVMMQVHNLVPHHHHKGSACFVELHHGQCDHNGTSNGEGNNTSHNHSHPQSCSLLNDITQAEKFRFIGISFVSSTIHFEHDLLTGISAANIAVLTSIFFRQVGLIDDFPLRQRLLISSFLFRAPPF